MNKAAKSFLIFKVQVVPRASKSEIVGEHNGALKVKITAPPTGGAANAELIKVLAKNFGVAKSSVEITGGQTSKHKQVRISGVNAEDFPDLIGSQTADNFTQQHETDDKQANG